jgi:hypothetical protein
VTGRAAAATLLALALALGGLAWWLGRWVSERLSLGPLGLLPPLGLAFLALGAAERYLARLAPPHQDGDEPHG